MYGFDLSCPRISSLAQEYLLMDINLIRSFIHAQPFVRFYNVN